MEPFGWIEGKDMIADVLMKQGSKRDGADKVMVENMFENAMDEKNILKYRDGEIRISNLTVKGKK